MLHLSVHFRNRRMRVASVCTVSMRDAAADETAGESGLASPANHMTTINEIAPDVFRLSLYVPEFNLQFNHFLVRDE